MGKIFPYFCFTKMMEYKLVKNAAMKRILFMLFAVIMSTAVCHARMMSNSKVRKEKHAFLRIRWLMNWIWIRLSIMMYMKLIMTLFQVYVIWWMMCWGVKNGRWIGIRLSGYTQWRFTLGYWAADSIPVSCRLPTFSVRLCEWRALVFPVYVTYTNPNHFYYPRPYHYRTALWRT